MGKAHIGFIGAGGIARAHAYALNSLKYYYNEVPEIILESVTARRAPSRDNFAKKFGFSVSEELTGFIGNRKIDTVFILGPNKVHYEHLKMAQAMPGVRRIYIEKPVCASRQEEEKIKEFIDKGNLSIQIQVGFQFMQAPAVRAAYNFWKSGILGKPIHFDIKYYHGDYLKKEYRDKRATRLTPAPDGGAMADLGSHVISMIMAFLGEQLKIVRGMQGGGYKDVPEDSDLFSTISLYDTDSKAVGNLSASRISAGTGDWVNLEIYAEKGSLKYSSLEPDHFEYFLEAEQKWIRQTVGSRIEPVTSFPSGHVPPGWLRSMIHAHYLFLTRDFRNSFVPDLSHGLAVQRLIRQTAEQLGKFRSEVK